MKLFGYNINRINKDEELLQNQMVSVFLNTIENSNKTIEFLVNHLTDRLNIIEKEVEAIKLIDEDLADLEKAVKIIIKQEGIKDKIYDGRKSTKTI